MKNLSWLAKKIHLAFNTCFGYITGLRNFLIKQMKHNLLNRNCGNICCSSHYILHLTMANSSGWGHQQLFLSYSFGAIKKSILIGWKIGGLFCQVPIQLIHLCIHSDKCLDKNPMIKIKRSLVICIARFDF